MLSSVYIYLHILKVIPHPALKLYSLNHATFRVLGSTMISASYDETLVVWDVENACKKFSLHVKTSKIFVYADAENR